LTEKLPSALITSGTNAARADAPRLVTSVGAQERSRMIAARKIALMAVLVTALTVGFAACGGGSSSSTGTAAEETTATAAEETTATEAEEATSSLAPAPPEEPPASIPTLPPLPKAPPTGVKAVALQCDVAACVPLTKNFEEAATKIGWDLTNITYKTGQPSEAIANALNVANVKYIAVNGVTRSTFEPQLKAACEKEVQIVQSATQDAPDPSACLPAIIAGSHTNNEVPVEYATRWIINHSEGNADILLINVPEAPQIKVTYAAMVRNLERYCPECGHEEVGLTSEELVKGEGPAKVVAALQSHPDVNYILPAFNNLILGVPEAVKTAGLSDKVTIIGNGALEPAEAKYIKNGEIEAWAVHGEEQYGWYQADAMVRLAEGLPVPQKVYDTQPEDWVCVKDQLAECEGWGGPANFRDEFLELWKVK
jgi:ABC-type sugar transport system substrate-binding protein